MAAPILPQEVTEHLEAAIQLANRRVHLRFLDEAELLLTFNLPTAAVLVAGVVLEAILAGSRGLGGSQDPQRMEEWAELRNRVAHAQVARRDSGPGKKDGRRCAGLLDAGDSVRPTPCFAEGFSRIGPAGSGKIHVRAHERRRVYS